MYLFHCFTWLPRFPNTFYGVFQVVMGLFVRFYWVCKFFCNDCQVDPGKAHDRVVEKPRVT